nr:immunoglobulin light chain junction region [Macaca mulatta]MOV63799.1 immunoglobulin light chain junction region [Macaca mulatta]
CQQAYTYPHSF